MLQPPKKPERLPQLEHNGVPIEVLKHYGFSSPKGNEPKSRILYGARDKAEERHWRASYDEIKSLIDRDFKEAALASGLT